MKIGNLSLKWDKNGEKPSDLSKNPQNSGYDSVYTSEKWIGQPAWNEEDPNNDVLLDSLIQTTCVKNDCDPKKGAEERKYSIEFLVNNLPSITTVANMYTQLIVGGGLVADSADGNEKLQKWLKQKPMTGMTHQAIINDAIQNAVIYGYTGLRYVKGLGLLPVHPQYFKIWKLPYMINGKPVPCVSDEFLYEVHKKKRLPLAAKGDGKIMINGVKYTLSEVVKQREWKKAVDGSFYIDDEKNGAVTEVAYIPKANFCHLRHTLEGDYGESILNRDRLRLNMMVDLILNMNDEINNDGNDYVMWLKEQNIVGASLTSMLSPAAANAAVIGSNSSQKITDSIAKKKMEGARALAKSMKRSAKTRIAIVKKDVVEDFQRIDGTARLIDYYPFLNDATTIIANAFGLHPILAGSTSSGWNTSMSSVIQFTLEKIIVPFQRMYSTELEDYIQKATGIKSSIHFKEYDLSDRKALADIEETISRTKKNLAQEQEIINNIRIAKKESTDGTTTDKSTNKSE